MRGIQVGTNFENELILLVNYFMFIIIYYFIYGFLMPCWLQGIGIEILKKSQGCQSWKPLVWLRTPNIISLSKELKDNILIHGRFIPLERSVGNSATGDGVLKRNSLDRLKQQPQAKSWGPLTLHKKFLNKPTAPLWSDKGKGWLPGTTWRRSGGSRWPQAQCSLARWCTAWSLQSLFRTVARC